jgi:hypothetical protein
MSARPSKIALLRKIVGSIRTHSLTKGPPTEQYLQSLKLARFRIQQTAVVGIPLEAAAPFHELAAATFNGSKYERGTTFAALMDQLFTVIIDNYADKTNVAAKGDDLAFVEGKLEEWFRSKVADHEFYIPCILSARHAPTFSVGPVRFAHIEDFVAAQSELAPQPVFEVSFKNIFEQMGKVGASWIATVSVKDCTTDRAEEIANLAVDLALTSVQLCLPNRNVERMARVTGRTMPAIQHAASRSGGVVSFGGSNKTPLLAFAPGALEYMLAGAKLVLTSCGRRVSGFVDGKYRLARLELAWCDAAYWFHEGCAEPLDTIAVAKLETVLEVLLGAGSSKGSESRLLAGMHAFYGLEPGDFIDEGSQITVKEFAKGFVRDRSRILHGTWSTLNHSLRASRQHLTQLVSSLLRDFAVAIDDFAPTGSAADDLDALLEFIRSHRPKPSPDGKVNGGSWGEP